MTSIRHVISEADDIGVALSSTGSCNEEMVCGGPDVLRQEQQHVEDLIVVESTEDADDVNMRLDPVVPTNTTLLSDRHDMQRHTEQQQELLESPPFSQLEVIGVSAYNNMHEQQQQQQQPSAILYNRQQLDIPPTIQSLQQQYYSSSSLSGDEDDDDIDEPLVQGVVGLKSSAADVGVPTTNNDAAEITNSHKLETIDTPATLTGAAANALSIQQQQLIRQDGAPIRRLTTTTTTVLPRVQSGSSSTQSSSSRVARSSQNSSRDWGWFDDVHASNHSAEMISARGAGGNHHMIGVGKNPIPGSGGNGNDPTDMNKQGKNRVTIADPSVIMMMNDDDTDTDTNVMAVTAPHYVLEESLSSQFLWKNSAGQRPPQPMEERAFYEKMWAQNFERSNVEYNIPVEVLTATSPLSLDPYSDGNCDADYPHNTISTVPPIHHPDGGGVGTPGTDIAEAALVYRMNDDRHQIHLNHNNNHHYNSNSHNNNTLHNYYSAPVKREVKDTSGDGTLTVLVRGDNVFGTTVSKSFARTNKNGDPIAGGVDTINISIASYRVVESSKHGKYAQFLVIYRQGSIRDTIGIWKRYRDFEELAHKVTQAHEGCVAAFANISPLHITTTGSSTNGTETEHLPNAITSWRLLKKRKRWYRCLDAGYLSLKVFLLERFLHDILFESSSPHLLRDFVGVNSVTQMF